MPVAVFGALAGPGAMAAAKHMAYQAAMSIEMYAVTSATFAAFLAQMAWKRIPAWIKEDISFRNLLQSKTRQGGEDEGAARAELSHLGSVIDKLVAQAEAANIIPVPHIHAAVLAYIQLAGQLKRRALEIHEEIGEGLDPYHAEGTGVERKELTRDFLYQRAGTPCSPEELCSFELRESLELATWAYYENSEMLEVRLDTLDFALLQHSLASLPGHVAYYVAVSSRRKQIVVGVKGTSNLEEILTDCCGKAVPLIQALDDADKARVEVRAKRPQTIHTSSDGAIVEVESGDETIWVENHDEDGDNFIRCHEGVLLAAHRMIDTIQPLIEQYIVKKDYQLILCGHSLGAGAAALGAVILRTRLPELVRDENSHRIRVYAFAPPPVLDHDTAVAAASFCTTVVNNADIIPRTSLANLLVFMEFMRIVNGRLEQEGLNPTGPLATAAFMTKLAQGSSGELLLSVEETNAAIQEAQEKVQLRNPHHLYIPGRVLLAYHPWSLLRGTESEEKDTESSTSVSPASQVLECTITTGMAPVLRLFEIDGVRMFTDHITSSYYFLLGMEYSF
jgi:pimeloyl-ACP methyl ester carboxylesterase